MPAASRQVPAEPVADQHQPDQCPSQSDQRQPDQVQPGHGRAKVSRAKVSHASIHRIQIPQARSSLVSASNHRQLSPDRSSVNRC